MFQLVFMKEECSLCGRVFPYYALKRCFRCRRLFCRDCVLSGRDASPFIQDGNIVCIRCAKKLVSPRKVGTKYTALCNYLVRRAEYSNFVKLSFAKIEAIIGDNLPSSALRTKEWWRNTERTPQGRSWLVAGWEVRGVSLEERAVAFEKTERTGAAFERQRKKRKYPLLKKPFQPAPVQPYKRRVPSKTRIAHAQARLRNIEFRRAHPRQYRGKFKQRSPYEKRLYKTHEPLE